MAENEYGKSSHLSIFTFLKHLMMLLKWVFSGLHFDTLSKRLRACGAIQLRFLCGNKGFLLLRLGGGGVKSECQLTVGEVSGSMSMNS